jgi:hypothetical protein
VIIGARHFPVKQSQRTPPTSGMYLKKNVAEDLDGLVPSDYIQ